MRQAVVCTVAPAEATLGRVRLVRRFEVPHTAKFSRQFYERLSDQVANELVGWLNTVDLTYKSELRELNDLNFQKL